MPNISGCTKEVVDRALHYVNGGFEEEGQAVPTTSGLAIYLDVSRATVYDWPNQQSNKYKEEFAAILDRVQAVQEVRALNGALQNKLNAVIAKTILANHGYSDRQSIENTHKIVDDGSHEW